MIKPFKGNYPQTQGFGENPDIYAQFGLKGHNGLDYGTPTGTEIIAPISGTVTEAVRSGDSGYGKYIKIESDEWGSLTAHLQSVDVEVGQQVTEGQHIGISDNTGFSTGPHLHWGIFSKPRDRSNGYDGYIDQTTYITNPTNDTVPVDKKVFEQLVTKATAFDKFVAGGFNSIDDVNKRIADLTSQIHDFSIQVDALNAKTKHDDQFHVELSQLLNCQNDEGEIIKSINEDFSHIDSVERLTKQIADLQNNLAEANLTIDNTQTSLKTATNDLATLKGQYKTLDEEYKTLLSTSPQPIFKFKLFNRIIEIF